MVGLTQFMAFWDRFGLLPFCELESNRTYVVIMPRLETIVFYLRLKHILGILPYFESGGVAVEIPEKCLFWGGLIMGQKIAKIRSKLLCLENDPCRSTAKTSVFCFSALKTGSDSMEQKAAVCNIYVDVRRNSVNIIF